MYAHPDDESFGVAGTAMKLTAAGHTTAERVTADVVQFMREIRPEVVCTFGPEGAGSEHDDHRAASFHAVRRFHRAALADQYPDRGAPHAARRLFRDRFNRMLERRGGKEFFHLAIDCGATEPGSGDLLV